MKNGIAQKDICAAIKGVKGNDKDLANAIIVVNGDVELGSYDSYSEQGDMEVTLTGPGDTYMGGPGDYTAEIGVTGETEPEYEYTGPDSAYGQDGEQKSKPDKQLDQQGAALGGGLGGGIKPNKGGPVGGSGSPNGGGNKDNDKKANDKEPTQIETIVEDPCLRDEFGVVEEQIENKMVPTKEQLFDIGVRRFREIKMERNKYSVELDYLPCLELNQVVEFNTPPTFEGGRRHVTGLLTEMKVSYNPAPEAKMSIIVESFEDLTGDCEIESETLLDINPEFTSQENTDFVDGSTGDASAVTENGGITLYTAGGAPLSTAVYSHPTVVDVDYIVQFTLSQNIGNPLDWAVFSITDGMGSIYTSRS